MWVQVTDNEVVRTLSHPVEIVKNGVKYPKSIFTKWSASDLKGIGIYPYSSNTVDSRYHYTGELSYTIGADSVTGTYAISDRDVDSMKESMISKVRNAASNLLSKHDWMSIREAEGGTAMPADVKTYRAAIRTESNAKEAEVNALADMDAIKAYEATSYTEVRKVAEYDADGNFTGWSADTESYTRHMDMTTYYEAVDPTADVDESFVSLTKD